MDNNLLIAIIVIAVVVLIVLIMYRKKLKKFIFKVSSDGVEGGFENRGGGVVISKSKLKGKDNQIEITTDNVNISEYEQDGENTKLTVAKDDNKHNNEGKDK